MVRRANYAGSTTLNHASASRIELGRSDRRAVPEHFPQASQCRSNEKERRAVKIAPSALGCMATARWRKAGNLAGQSSLARSEFRSFWFFRSADSISYLRLLLHQSAAENFASGLLSPCTACAAAAHLLTSMSPLDKTPLRLGGLLLGTQPARVPVRSDLVSFRNPAQIHF